MFPFTSPSFTLILHLALAALVYHDQRLNGRSGIGWAALVFFLGVWGLIIYILFNVDTLKLAARRLRGESLTEKLASPSRESVRDHPDYTELSLPPGIKIETNDFVDHRLESLLEEGKLPAARTYLENILKVAREMGDEETVRRYEVYRERVGGIG